MITAFTGRHAFLSNFYPVPVRFDHQTYPSVEHAYQAAKSTNPVARAMFRSPKLTPGAAKRLGRTLTLRPDWEEVKVAIMTDLLRTKFADPLMRAKLLATGEEELVEGNTWGDRTWGMVEGPKGWVGENLLGKALMTVRKEIRV